MTTLNTTKLMELFRYLQTFIWLNKNPSTLYSDSFFNWNKSITTWRICLQCQRNCFCPSLQIYKTFKFSFSQCLRTTFKISHLYKAVHQPRPIMFIWMCCCCCPGGTPRIWATSLGFLTPTVPPYLRNSVSYSSVSRVRLLAAWIRENGMNINSCNYRCSSMLLWLTRLLLGLLMAGPGPLLSVSLSLESMSACSLAILAPGAPRAVLGLGMEGRGPIRPLFMARPLLPGSGCWNEGWGECGEVTRPRPVWGECHTAPQVMASGKVDHQGQMNFI